MGSANSTILSCGRVRRDEEVSRLRRLAPSSAAGDADDDENLLGAVPESPAAGVWEIGAAALRSPELAELASASSCLIYWASQVLQGVPGHADKSRGICAQELAQRCLPEPRRAPATRRHPGPVRVTRISLAVPYWPLSGACPSRTGHPRHGASRDRLGLRESASPCPTGLSAVPARAAQGTRDT